MFRNPPRNEPRVFARDEGIVGFADADVLFALEWSAVTPGIGGWDVGIDDERCVRLVSVAPPGGHAPAFFIHQENGEVVMTWLNDNGDATEIGRVTSLRAAVLALCPLDEDRMQAVNESMEILYPRTLRDRKAR